MIGDRGHARKQPVVRRVLEREDKRRQIAARATRRARGTLCCRTRCRLASSHRPGSARAPTAATSVGDRRGTRSPPRPRAIRGCAAIARGSVSPRATARRSAGVPEAQPNPGLVQQSPAELKRRKSLDFLRRIEPCQRITPTPKGLFYFCAASRLKGSHGRGRRRPFA